MSRPQVFYDIPQEWINNRDKKLCPPCGKQKDAFEKGMRVYCSKKCRELYDSKIYTWDSKKSKILKEHGHKCAMCGITKEALEKEQQEKEHVYKEKMLKNARDKIEYLKKTVMDEIESLNDLLENEEELLRRKGHLIGYSDGYFGYRETGYVHRDFEVDHIIALVNGGDMWDEKNLQVLCDQCHHKKTTEDMRKSKQ